MTAEPARAISAANVPRWIGRLRGGHPQKIVFYGTSLTADGAWVRLLGEALRGRFGELVQLVNRAKSGEHSRWGRTHFSERVLSQEPDVLFLEFSVNDATERFAISSEMARENLENMLEATKASFPDCEVILQVMNPVIDRPPGHSGYRPNLAAYQQMYRDVAAERGLCLIDHMPAWTEILSRDEDAFRTLVPDGLHPGEEGYKTVVMPKLLKTLDLTP